VRKVEQGSSTKFFLTLKGKGLTQRKEYEKEITKEEANEYIFDNAVSYLEKNRYVLLFDNFKFEFDEYLGELTALKTVEVEVSKDDKKIYDKIILSLTKMRIKFQDITLDPKYKNINLAKENVYENSKFDRRVVL
jgi:adenylate cyclase